MRVVVWRLVLGWRFLMTILTVTSLTQGFSSTGTTLMRLKTPEPSKLVCQVHNVRDADIIEQMVGGVRYSMVPMPEPMKATTAYVGNLCEFVNDKDLSELFSQLSTLHSIPSCVVRKPDTTSLQYGFVSFPTVKEKERAIIQFHGYEWRGRQLKVEPIREHPKQRGGVRIPEQLVEYVYGPAPRESPQRPSPKKKKKQAKPSSLNEVDRAEFERATRKGFLSLSKQQRHETSSLLHMHREWCKTKDKPQIVLFKAVGISTVDQVVIDLSTIALDKIMANIQVLECQILEAAAIAGMDLCQNKERADSDKQDDFDAEDPEPCLLPDPFGDNKRITHISDISSIRFGGIRSNAKTMASQLANAWDIPVIDDVVMNGDPEVRCPNEKRKRKTRRLSDHRPRRRGGGHRQAW